MSESQSVNHIDVTAPTLEQAIKEGLERLGLSRNDVIIEIVEEGSRGVLGMGQREAVVRLTPLRPPTNPIVQPEPPAPPTPPAEPATPEPPTPPAAEPAPLPAAPSPPSQEVEEPVWREVEPAAEEIEEPVWREVEPAEEEVEPPPAPEPEPPARERATTEGEGISYDAQLAQETLRELLEHMGMASTDINVYHAEPASPEEEAPWILNIEGEDLGILIGRRGETLNALQYITRLIVSRELQRRANIVIDVEDYKARRESTLERLARKMAEQAKRLGKTVTLEPMPPNERRVIHVTLREDSEVETESIGSGDDRKVTIIPVRGSSGD
jgi:spoIIIJ-associated protein